MTLRVAIADDSFLIREALRELLGRAPEVQITSCCEDERSLVEAAEKHINAIFRKLNLRESEETSRRVKAALISLADTDTDTRDGTRRPAP